MEGIGHHWKAILNLGYYRDWADVMEEDSIPEVLTNYEGDLAVLCRQHRVIYVAAFGTVTTAFLREESGLDLHVAFGTYLPLSKIPDGFSSLKLELESLFNQPVDLITKAF